MKIIGHRGARGLAPENTIASLRKGLAHHVDELEFDLRVTKDDVVVLHHNAYLTDPNGVTRTLAEHTFAELRQHKKDLPTFEEVLEAIGHPVPLYVEVKPGEPTEPIIRIIKKYLAKGWEASDFRFGSYDQKILLELHAAFPEVQTIVIENWSAVRATRRARQLNTKRLSMLEYWLWSGVISALSRRGYEVYSFPPMNEQKERRFAKIGLTGYTNNRAKAQRWEKYGLYGVVTDYPDRFEK